MSGIEAYFQKHQFILHSLGGILALAVTLTAYAYTNFQTKAEAAAQAIIVNDALDKRLDRIEKKVDHILEHLPRRGNQ